MNHVACHHHHYYYYYYYVHVHQTEFYYFIVGVCLCAYFCNKYVIRIYLQCNERCLYTYRLHVHERIIAWNLLSDV